MKALDRAFTELDKHRRGMPEDVLDQYVNKGAVEGSQGPSCLDEVKKLQNEKVSDKELLGTKSTFLTHHLMESESTNGQATMVAMAEILGGDYKLSRTLPDRVRAVTPDTVMAFAKKHLGKLQVVYLGDPSKADKALFESL